MSDIKTLDQLKHFLYLAMQLEHATVPPYLTALYSINFGTNPDATQILRVIAVEEMLHLTLAANILNAIGGQPDLTCKGFVPDYPAALPDGENDFKVSLLPFNKQALEGFLQIERPGMAPKPEKRLMRKSAAPTPNHLIPSPPDNSDLRYYSIGEFYKAIEAGLVFLESEAKTQDKTIFIPDNGRQITPEYYYSGGGKVHAVVDLATAKSAIDLIVEQGEGETLKPYSEDGELAHYYRFEQLKLEQYYMPDTSKPTGPTFKVDWDAVQPITPNLKLAQLPEGSELRRRAEDFNRKYAEFLALLTRAYNGEPNLLLEAVPMMFRFRDRIVELVRNPVPGLTTHAGPTFEI